ncbi:MAG: 23S rRNA (uracil(1939)-C(5))-methyltransferase RlmD [Clostridia bacterium]|nr:23S rRNA (uracil(1939)-C(5))-methyltransferase RlmD [Clostridia bacterium]
MVNLNEIYEVVIEDTNIFANGVCHIDSFVVFVENALKGEKCKIQISKVHPRFAYAKCNEVLESNINRTAHVCDKYEKCGGCSFLHTSINFENETKENFVKSVFTKNKINAIFEKIICPVSEKYRNKIVLFYNGQSFGYNEKSTTKIIEHTSCILNNEIFDNIALFTAKALKGTPLRALYLRKNRDNTEIMVCPIFYTQTSILEYVSLLLKEFPNVKTVLTASIKDKDFATEKLTFKTVYGDGYITDTLCGLSFKISPKSFYQVNPDCAELLYKKAIELLNPQPNEQIADLFCGTGTMGIITAKRTNCKAYGIEIEPSAVKDARTNAKLNGVTNIEFKAQDASKFDKQIDSCIIDPPRKGCSKLMLDTLLRLKPKRIVYVSCNPDTMCNDLKALLNDYAISSPVYTYNQFPRTSHTESIVMLTLK